MIVEKLTDFKELVWDAIKSFIQKSIIEAALVFILSLLNPIGAFIKVCMAIYDFLMMLVRFKDRIIELLDTILSAVTNIASGAVESAAAMIEKALAKSISVIIGFLAALLHLNNIFAKIREIITRIQKRVEKALDWVIKKAYSYVGKYVEGALKLEDKAAAAVEKGKQAAVGAGKKVAGKVLGWLGLRKEFNTVDGKSHSVYFKGEGEFVQLTVASTPKALQQLISDRRIDLENNRKKYKNNAPKLKEVNDKLKALDGAEKLKPKVDKNVKAYAEAVKTSKKKSEELKDKINIQMDEIKDFLKIAGVDKEGSNNVNTEVKFVSTSKGSPKIIKALPLTKIPGNTAGSQPATGVVVGWNSIPNKLKKGDNWVAAHILNHQLHGPGEKENLVCGTKETNNNMKTEVENKAKKNVQDNPDKQYFFVGEVTYYPKQSGIPGEINFDDNMFPQTINTRFGEAIDGPGGYSEGTLIASRPFSQDKPKRNKTEMAAFNESSASKLSEEASDAGFPVSTDGMKFIVNARRSMAVQSFGNLVEDMIKTVDAYCVKEEGKNKGYFDTMYGPNIRKLVKNGDILMSF